MELVISCMPVDFGILRVPSLLMRPSASSLQAIRGFYVLIILVGLLVSRTVCDSLVSFGETVSFLVIGHQLLCLVPSVS